jgi:hypothetical protein
MTMAGFKTHITFSSLLGAGGATAAHLMYNVPLSTCILAGGLCSVSGMLPDIDSDSGVPVRESLAFAAAIVPVMLASHFKQMGLDHEYIILIGAAIYLFIRFVVANLLKHYTAHRGMFHSIPAAIIFGELAFLLSCRTDPALRWFQAGAVTLGYLSHLVLDEIWSLQLRIGYVHVKKSFGTAVKLFGDNLWANLTTYAKLALLTFLVLRQPNFMRPAQEVRPQDSLLQAVQQTLTPSSDSRPANSGGLWR